MSDDKEKIIDWYDKQCEGLAQKEYLYIKCKVNKEFAEKLLQQTYSKVKPFDGLELYSISWDGILLDKDTIDKILLLLGREP